MIRNKLLDHIVVPWSKTIFHRKGHGRLIKAFRQAEDDLMNKCQSVLTPVFENQVNTNVI